jgi:hypothetical protein
MVPPASGRVRAARKVSTGVPGVAPPFASLPVGDIQTVGTAKAELDSMGAAAAAMMRRRARWAAGIRVVLLVGEGGWEAGGLP